MSQQNPLVPFLMEYGSHTGGEGIIRFVWDYFIGPMEPHPETGAHAEFDKWQLDVLNAFGEGERQISISACHGPGKTAVAAWCILYTVLFRYPCRAVATAPTRGQLEGALMSEVQKWHAKLPPTLQALVEIKAKSVHLKSAPGLAYFEARTARPENPEALQGIHEEEGWVFLLVDEASGVHEKIFESAGGSMSGHNCQTMLLSNPTRSSGFFFKTHHSERDRWFTVRIGHEDSARVTDQFVEDMAARYGRDSNTFRVRALGLFPRSDLDTLVPFEVADAARNRDITPIKGARPIWGVDVARFGDNHTVIVQRTSRHVLPKIYHWDQADTMTTAGRIRQMYQDALPDDRPIEILVDVIGVGGGVVDRLLELNLPVRGINVAETSSFKKEYRNLRTELAFKAKEWLEKRESVLPHCDNSCLDRSICVHERLISEVTSIKYDFTSTGKFLLESKKDMRKRGLKSPDVADAFFLTFASEPATLVHGSHENWNYPWNEEISRGIVTV